MKKVLFLFILAFGIQASQAQIKKYKPKSYKDSFLEWLEVGVAGYQGKILDKQYSGTKYSEYQGISFDVKLKIKHKFFIYGTYKHGLPGYERDFLHNGFGSENYLTRYQMSEMFGGFGFHVIGHHKSRFAFSPIAPGFGVMNYEVKLNFIQEGGFFYDKVFTGTNAGIGNISSMQFRTGKVNIFAMLHVFTSMNNTNKPYITSVGVSNEEHFSPEYFLYTFHFGFRLRI